MSYVPSIMPELKEVEELRKFLESEMTRIAQAFQSHNFVVFQILHVVPERPTPGMVVFADGTDWNPGSGRGLYEYRVASWVKL